MESKNSAPSSYRVVELAELLGINEATVRKWAKTHDIPSWKDGNGRHFAPSMLYVFERIKTLKADGMTDEQITPNIQDDLKAERERVGKLPNLPDLDLDTVTDATVRRLKPLIEQHAEAQSRAVLSLLQDKYGEAREQIGAFQAQVRYLAAQLEDAQVQAKLLPEKAESLRAAEAEAQNAAREVQRLTEELKQASGSLRQMEMDYQSLTDRLERTEAKATALQEANDALEQRAVDLSAELDAKNKEVEALKSELERERSRTVWDRMMGKK